MLAAKRNEVSKTEADKGKAVQRNSEEISPSPINPLWHQFATSVPGVQAKLKIGQPGDKYEQEADRVAEQVMRMAKSETPTSPATSPALAPWVQRHESVGEPAHGQPQSSAAWITPRFEGYLQSLRGGGQPLTADSRIFFEPHFRVDFSQVRLHTDANAAEAAKSIQARAFTYGQDIVFGGGQYSAASKESKRLLGHELAHVVQQSCTNADASPNVVQREPGDKEKRFAVYYLPNVGLEEEVEKELLRRGILKPGDYDSWEFSTDGYLYLKGVYWVVNVSYIRDADNHVTGYKVLSALQAPAQKGDSTAQGSQAKPASQGKAAPKTAPPRKQKPKPKPKSTAAAEPNGQAEPKTDPPVQKSDDEIKAELAAMPQAVKDLLFDPKGMKLEHDQLAQLLRIANKLKQLEPQDLVLYKLLVKKLSKDLNAFEKSVDFFIRFKKEIGEQGKAESQKKEPTLEEKLAETWKDFDELKFSGMSAKEKEAKAREIAAEQRNIQLKHMSEHPGETALDMAEGLVRVDKIAKAIAEDAKEAADSSKSGYASVAGAVGAYNKYLAGVAGIVFIALLFVPGVDLVELAIAGIAVASATIILSAVESELRIKAASQAKSAEDFKTQTAKAAAAQTQGIVAAAMLALMLVAKLMAKIPLRGRYQNVGAALDAAKTALLEKSGVSPAWQAVKGSLLQKLRTSKQGLSESLAEQSKPLAETVKAVAGMTGDEFVEHLAKGDPKLAELGISADEAKAMQKVAATPEGKGVTEQLRQDSLKALEDAPVEAQKKVDHFVNDVDDAIKKVEQATSEQQLKSAVDDVESKLGPDAQAKQAVKDEQAFVKERMESARRSSIREQATQKLEELQSQQAKTNTKIAELEQELSAAVVKVRQLKEKILKLSKDDPERPKLMKEFKKAEEELADIKEGDELGGYLEERKEQRQTEENILESLELKRPDLYESTKETIRKAAKRNKSGQFLDPNTGKPVQKPVYGHKYGFENRRLILKASSKGFSQKQFTEWVNKHPEWFQIEEKVNNESHAFEKKGVAGWEKIGE